MSSQNDDKKELDKLLGLYKLVFKNGTSTEVPAAGPQHAVRVLALALGLPEKWVWNSLREIHVIKDPEVPLIEKLGEAQH
jgi:hypothetical protein